MARKRNPYMMPETCFSCINCAIEPELDKKSESYPRDIRCKLDGEVHSEDFTCDKYDFNPDFTNYAALRDEKKP